MASILLENYQPVLADRMPTILNEGPECGFLKQGSVKNKN
jgi:hypothetical protein